MVGAELGSYCDPKTDLSACQAQPFVGGSSHPGKYQIQSGATSYIFIGKKVTSVTTDYVNTVRPTFQSTSGAHQQSGTYGTPKKTFEIEYTPLNNRLCSSSPRLDVSIKPLISSAGLSTTNPPRLYYKLSTQTNQVPSSTQNTSAFNGWKWVNATTSSGDIYSFDMDLSKVGTITPTANIEYFVVAQDNGTINATTYVTTAEVSFSLCCVTNVDLYTSGGNSNINCIPDVGSMSSFVQIGGASLIKTLELNVNSTIYSANNATSVSVCPGDTVAITAHYSYNGSPLDIEEYRWERASNTAFTTNLQTGISSDSMYSFIMPAHSSDMYIRIAIACSGTKVASSETYYTRVTTIGCPDLTSSQSDLSLCIGSAYNITATNANPSTSATARQYFLADSKGLTTISAGTTTSTTKAFTGTLSDTALTGTWRSAVGLLKATLANGGFKQATLAADLDNQRADLSSNRGMLLSAQSFTKLNSVILFDDTNDGNVTSGHKLVLYEANSTKKLYETTALANITNGATQTVTFTNWVIAPGNYILLVEEAVEGTAIDGGLLSPLAMTFPVNVGSSFQLLGSVSDVDASSVENVYSYFLDWNITTYCTSSIDEFEVNVIPSSLMYCSPLLHHDATKSVTASSTNVSIWSDVSNNDKNATQSTNNPQIPASGASIMNFNKTITFNGTNQYFDQTSGAFPSSTTGRNYFIVAEPSSTTTMPLLAHGATATTGQYMELGMSDDKIAFSISSTVSASGSYSSINAPTSAPKIGAWYLDYAKQVKDVQLYINGSSVAHASANTTAINNTNTANYIGRSTPTSPTYYNGAIGEIISYGDTLSIAQKLQIHSYLAIKWGITLQDTSYSNSSDELVWDIENNRDYHNNVFGIGRDDATSLHQRQSKSVNQQALITLGNNNVIAAENTSSSGNDITTNKSYLIIGDNNGSLDLSMMSNDEGECMRILNRSWKVQESGTIGTVMLRVPAYSSSLATKLPAFNSNLEIMIDSDGDFSSGATSYPMTLNGTNWEVNIDLTDGVFFTFNTNPPQDPVIVLSTTDSTSTSYCVTKSYNYYRTPNSETNVLTAINPNGNTWSPTLIQISNSGTMGDAFHKKQSGAFTTEAMPYMLTIQHAGSLNTNGGVKVRCYYPQSQYDQIATYTNKRWFKHQGTKIDVLNNLIDTGFINVNVVVWLNPDSTGTEGGIPFVEFYNIKSFSTFGFLGSNSPQLLPIELSKFNGKCNGDRTSLKWTTDTELNNEQFIVQGLVGSIWENIGTVKGAGTTQKQQNYQFEVPNQKENNGYYRLAQIDFDGSTTYSNIIKVKCGNNFDNPGIIIYPNPNTYNVLNIKLTNSANTNKPALLYLFNRLGQLIYQQSIVFKNNTVQIPISDLEAGSYHLQIKTENNTFNENLLINQE